MAASEREGEIAGAVEGGVGTIVWVRRRNGSWWPGRILGQHELSASHLMSPRSGTPVKLLGREDASVDWYNLEKSKRVKAFRCGEFDACIERAEASLGGPIRKREKYARREDAILHALELEKRHLKPSHPLRAISVVKAAPLTSIAPLEPVLKLPSSRAPPEEVSGSRRALEESIRSARSPTDPSSKRKRSHGILLEESLGKRRDRQRPLVHVLKSSAKFVADSDCQLASDVGNHPSIFLHDDPDDVLISYHAEGIHVPGSPSLDGGATSMLVGDDDNGSSEGEADDMLLQEGSSTEDEDMPSKISDGRRHRSSNDEDEDEDEDEPGVSKWHMKGKRNIRPTYPLKRAGLAAPSNGSSYFHKNQFFRDEDELSTDEEELAELRHGGSTSWQAGMVEVELKVQASYQGERVPLVSLMSRLNGKAIIGHPVPVEILADGAAADLLSPVASPSSATATPAWRTGRRTVMQRVPRPQLGHSVDDAARKKAAAKARKKSHKKAIASPSSQKTRTLSSIVTERRRTGKSGGSILGGLTKHGSGVVPPVTCVPIKVVFSRIMEAVGRPPSARRTPPTPL